MLHVAAIGECMVELRHRDEQLLELGFAGDTFNTALYMARCNQRERLTVDYVTALGSDPYSEAMLRSWREEGIGTGAVALLPGKLPGLYLIRTDPAGERHFFYYRSAAAARELFRDPVTDPLLAALSAYDVLYFTAITLSILGGSARERFRAALAAARGAGRLVVFDSNYRPAGWIDAAAARAAIAPFLDIVGLVLPTFEDSKPCGATRRRRTPSPATPPARPRSASSAAAKAASSATARSSRCRSASRPSIQPQRATPSMPPI